MESYVTVTYFQCLTTLNKDYFPLFHQHQKKAARAHRCIRNIIPDELHLFEQNDRIKDIDNIQHKLEPADITNIGFIMFNAMKN